jgi:hypothetical protein
MPGWQNTYSAPVSPRLKAAPAEERLAVGATEQESEAVQVAAAINVTTGHARAGGAKHQMSHCVA